jgi:hypothetical protein
MIIIFCILVFGIVNSPIILGRDLVKISNTILLDLLQNYHDANSLGIKGKGCLIIIEKTIAELYQ